MGIESPTHLIFIAIVALVVLGPKRLPDLARSLGNGIREFRQSLDMGAQDPPPPPPPQAPPPPAASTPPAPPPADVFAPPADAAAAAAPPTAAAAAQPDPGAGAGAVPDTSRQVPTSGPHEPAPPSS
jgi:TatA/E family protein of Tat protein translocase